MPHQGQTRRWTSQASSEGSLGQQALRRGQMCSLLSPLLSASPQADALQPEGPPRCPQDSL